MVIESGSQDWSFKLLHRLGSLIVLLVVLVPPLGIGVLTYQFEQSHLREHVTTLAQQVSPAAAPSVNGPGFDSHALRRILAGGGSHVDVSRIIVNSHGETLFSDGAPDASRTIESRAPLFHHGRPIGEAILRAPLTPLLHEVGKVFAMSLAAGTLLYLLLRLFAFRRLVATVNELNASREALCEENLEKEAALAEAAELAERLHHQATHDSLTGLPNRVCFTEHLDRSLARAEEVGEETAVIVLDLDRFKEINDTFGHQLGDEVLRMVATRLVRLNRDEWFLGRLGGDEFAFVLPGCGQNGAMQLAWDITTALGQPFCVGHRQFDVGASCGIAVSPWDAEQPADLLRLADVAMYDAKHNRKGIRRYEESKDPNSSERLALSSALKRSLQNNEIKVHFQPLRGFGQGRTQSLEALARWQRPDGSTIAPTMFIPLAEQIGFIAPLTYWILEQAIIEAVHLRASGYRLRIAVNISSHVFHEQDLTDRIEILLFKHGCPADALCLEITENVMMDDPVSVRRQLLHLHDLGVRISVDDFGTGYSSLAYLRDLPVSELKIDRSFVLDCRRSAKAVSLVQSIVHLAHDLGLDAVAEGVEDEMLCQRIGAMQCDLAQGFHICRPMPGGEIIDWLDDHEQLRSTPLTH